MRNKSERFVELANKRVNKAIKDLKLVGNLANRNNYEFTDEQAKKILITLQKEVDAVKKCFQSEVCNDEEFKL